jgi:hypothetical protein
VRVVLACRRPSRNPLNRRRATKAETSSEAVGASDHFLTMTVLVLFSTILLSCAVNTIVSRQPIAASATQGWAAT